MNNGPIFKILGRFVQSTERGFEVHGALGGNVHDAFGGFLHLHDAKHVAIAKY